MSLFNNVEPMQMDASVDECDVENNEAMANADHLSYQVESAPFEVESYAAQYSGYSKLTRLLYIADHCPPLQIEALELAMKFVKESSFNVKAYMQIYSKLSNALTAARQANLIEPIDSAWIDRTTNMSQVYQDKLETDLKNYKTNSIKESIRRGHDDLGAHFLSCGDLQTALKCFSRSRDYCMGDHHLFNICLNGIKLNIYLQNWNQVNQYIQKAESAEFNSSSATQTKIGCIAGLHSLVTGRYKQAAKRFISANIDDLNSDFSDIMSSNNVAIYGGLCSLATLSREELHKNVLSSASFKLFLELEPQLREAICKFYESKYPACLSLLDELKDAFLLDIYLADHVPSLYGQIRNRALIQYFSPYLSADLNLMAAAFNTTVASLENELMQLILDGQIQARIDSHNKILFAKDADPRLVTFEKALQMGREWQMKATSLILRAACVRHGSITVRPAKSGPKAEEVGPSSISIMAASPSSPNKSRN